MRAYKPELRVREYEHYKAVYCTLCRQLGHAYGPFARMTLSYDFTFLALLGLSLREECTGFEKKRCAFNPLKKCSYCKGGGEQVDFAAAAAMIMLYYKIRDNVDDGKGFKKLGYRLLLPLFGHTRRKAARLYPEVEAVVKEYIDRQNALERENCASVDLASEPTAAALSKLFAFCAPKPEDARPLERMGYCIGKWVYLIDAAADLERDLQTGNYNPLRFTAEGAEPDAGFIRQAQERAIANMNVCVAEAGRAFELLDIRRYRGILENVVYLGLPQSQKQVLEKEKCE